MAIQGMDNLLSMMGGQQGGAPVTAGPTSGVDMAGGAPVDPSQDQSQGMPSLADMPSAQSGDISGGMATPDQIDELRTLIAQIQQKHREYKSDQIMNNNEVASSQKDLINTIFSLLKEAGVDLNSQKSINGFLQQLEEMSPEISQMFTKILDQVMDPETQDSGPNGEDDPQLDLSQVPDENSIQGSPDQMSQLQ